MALPALALLNEYPYDIEEEMEHVEVVETPRQLKRLLRRLDKLRVPVAVDTEADDIDPKKESPAGKGIIVSAQLSWIEEAANTPLEELVDLIEAGEVEPTRVWIDVRDHRMLKLFQPWVESLKEKVLHNFDFDAHIFANHGVVLRGCVGDTLLMSRTQFPERMSHSLDGQLGLVRTILGDKRITTKQALGVNKLKKNGELGKSTYFPGMTFLVEDDDCRPYQQVYSTFDVYDTIRLYYILEARLREMEWEDEEEGYWKYYQEYVSTYIPVLHDMEREGVCIDPEYVDHLLETYSGILSKLEESIYEWAGAPINLNSSQQKAKLLYGSGEFDINDTKTKRQFVIVGKELPCKEIANDKLGEDELPSTDKEHLQWTMEQLNAEGLRESEDFEALVMLGEWSRLNKLVTATLEPLKRNLRARHATGRRSANDEYYYVHGTFGLVARTGRLSSSLPNLQNVPSRSEEGKMIRYAFTCEAGEVMLCCDYSQLELRILSYYVLALFGDSSLADALATGDLHQAMADKLGIPRSHAKAVNFGLVYGITKFKLAADLGMSEAEAQALLDNYFRLNPGVKKYMEWAKRYAHEHGTARTLRGRYRQLPDINHRTKWKQRRPERQAMNTPIQGSAQDIVQAAMLAIADDEELKSYGFVLRMQVHDELVATCKVEHKEAALARMIYLMENAFPPEDMEGIKFIVDGHWGMTWSEAKEGGRWECTTCGGKKKIKGEKCGTCKGEGATHNYVKRAA